MVHKFSHIHATYCVYEAVTVKNVSAVGSWMSAEELGTSGMSTAMKKVLALATGSAAKVMF